jgi:hypothetical protein
MPKDPTLRILETGVTVDHRTFCNITRIMHFFVLIRALLALSIHPLLFCSCLPFRPQAVAALTGYEVRFLQGRAFPRGTRYIARQNTLARGKSFLRKLEQDMSSNWGNYLNIGKIGTNVALKDKSTFPMQKQKQQGK